MANSMKTIVFIISLIAYFIYLSISSTFINAAIASGNAGYTIALIYISSGIGILVVLYTQAAVKYWFAGRGLKGAKVYVKLPLEKPRLTDRLLVYFLPALAIIAPIVQTRSLASITWQAVLFFLVMIGFLEILFMVHGRSMKAYITNKGIVVRGIDLRLEIPIPSNYHNPSGNFTFRRIITFLDLNDRLLVEQSYDMGTITLKGDTDALKQIKGVLLANEIRQKKF